MNCNEMQPVKFQWTWPRIFLTFVVVALLIVLASGALFRWYSLKSAAADAGILSATASAHEFKPALNPEPQPQPKPAVTKKGLRQFVAGQPMTCGTDINWKDCASVSYKEFNANVASDPTGPTVRCPKGFVSSLKKQQPEPETVNMCSCGCDGE